MIWHPDMPEAYRNQIVIGDARELAKAIPDESVDLIFTDPVYQNIDDYRWLAEMAIRVLKPNSACLTFCGIGWMDRTIMALEAGGLHWRWLLTANYAMRKQFHGRLQVSMSVCLWLEKGKTRMWASVADSTTLPPVREIRYKQASGASWDKHPKIVKRYINGFAPPLGTVYDPFTGMGGIPVHCIGLGRNFIASDIDPTTAETARQRVAQTQVPWFVALPEQLDLVEVQP